MGLVDRKGRFLRVNPAFCQLTGYSESELLGRTIREITHPHDRELDRQNMNQLLRGEISSYQREKRYIHKNGSVVWISVTGSVVRDESGKPLCLAGQVRNVTQIREEEDRLKAQLARRALLNGSGKKILKSKVGMRLLKVVNAIYREKSRPKNNGTASNQKKSLTRREQQILRLLRKDQTNRAVASALGISPRTVEVHRAVIKRKLGIASLAALGRKVS